MSGSPGFYHTHSGVCVSNQPNGHDFFKQTLKKSPSLHQHSLYLHFMAHTKKPILHTSVCTRYEQQHYSCSEIFSLLLAVQYNKLSSLLLPVSSVFPRLRKWRNNLKRAGNNYLKKTQKRTPSGGRLRTSKLTTPIWKKGSLMQNKEVIKMDYLNDADSMYVDSKVTWFWQSSAVTLQILQMLGWSWGSACAGGGRLGVVAMLINTYL